MFSLEKRIKRMKKNEEAYFTKGRKIKEKAMSIYII